MQTGVTLANFALVMKARLYHRRFFRKNTQTNVVELREYVDFKGMKTLAHCLSQQKKMKLPMDF
ncbi:MAG: hypothetical protein FAF03_00800 [Epsilonproteobacteria bacterium]|nr:hypothetical protein [Campylobacterota bacterium]